MKLTLRFLTCLCYFLPFTFFFMTCNGSGIAFAYNKADAVENEKKADSNRYTEIKREQDSIGKVETWVTDSASVSKDSLPITKDSVNQNIIAPKDNLLDRISKKIIMPTESSLSGIGAIFYFKNIMGRIIIAASVLLSLIMLIGFKFIKSSKTKKHLLFINLVLVVIFAFDCVVSDVTFLWGIFILTLLLIVQFLMEVSRKKIAKSDNQHTLQ